jgi:hypothetical protein
MSQFRFDKVTMKAEVCCIKIYYCNNLVRITNANVFNFTLRFCSLEDKKERKNKERGYSFVLPRHTRHNIIVFEMLFLLNFSSALLKKPLFLTQEKTFVSPIVGWVSITASKNQSKTNLKQLKHLLLPTLIPLSGVGTTCFSSCCDKDSAFIFTTGRLPDVNPP